MDSTIKIIAHQNKDALGALNSIIDAVFPGEEEQYLSLELNRFRTLQASLQDKFNENEAVKIIVNLIKGDLQSYLGTTEFLIQSNVYVRASRPNHCAEQENIGWHRESFYGPNVEKAVNVWTPLRGCDENNTLRYVPDSHLIPDEDIIVERKADKYTERYSLGHKLGFQYAPKIIVKGVDFSKAKRMIVDEANSAVFSGNLIHGAAENNSSKIRFSCDFRVIREKDLSMKNKTSHFASDKPYFIKI